MFFSAAFRHKAHPTVPQSLFPSSPPQCHGCVPAINSDFFDFVCPRDANQAFELELDFSPRSSQDVTLNKKPVVIIMNRHCDTKEFGLFQGLAHCFNDWTKPLSDPLAIACDARMFGLRPPFPVVMRLIDGLNL